MLKRWREAVNQKSQWSSHQMKTFRSEKGPVRKNIKRGIHLATHAMDSLSQGLNGLCGGNPAETLSSRAFRSAEGTFWHWVRRLLDTLLTPRTLNWCAYSYERSLERAKLLLRNK